ncbi:MAG: HNH endonuclease [Rhodobacteraceae bacterium]|nr:HNH endonuclease [Paracoccaceae bacterium]MBR9823724.1 HNH endonuclease [Paracoccaceae bacterium]
MNTARWQQLRLKVLLRDRYVCQQTGVLLIGKNHAPDSPVVDHKVPHRGDPDLFWDEGNLQSVSKAWHDSVKQSVEKRGEVWRKSDAKSRG